MGEEVSVIICAPDCDAVAAAALAGRAFAGSIELLAYDSNDLATFFAPPRQARMRPRYDLVICGPGLVLHDWDGRLVRPQVIEGLRRFGGTVTWTSAVDWHPEDRRAVAHLIGEANLRLLGADRSLAADVFSRCFSADDEYADSLARFGAGRLTDEESRAWGDDLARVLAALRADRAALGEAAWMLADGRRDAAIEMHGDRASEMERTINRIAGESAGPAVLMRDHKLVFVDVPADGNAFWEDIARRARESAEADFALARLAGRRVMILARGADGRCDLRAWARYVTDMLPGAQAVGGGPQAVPIVFGGPTDGPALKERVMELLASGAHLIRE